MQNEFEKQVREKMEELNLVPSAPVWDRVEEQIRQKKDRKRAIIWLPMLGLLLAGGIWWLNDAGNQPTFSGAHKAPTKIPSLQSTSETQVNQKQSNFSHSDQTSESDNQVNERNETRTLSPILPGSGASTSDREFKNEKTQAAPSLHLKNTNQFDKVKPVHQVLIAKQDQGSTVNNNVSEETNGDVILFHQQPDKKIQLQNEKAAKYILAPLEQSTPAIQYKPIVETNPGPHIVIRGTKKQSKPWEFGVAGSAGISGSKSGLNFLGGNKMMDAAVAAQSVQPPFVNSSSNNPSPQTINSNFAFSAGMAARKTLGKRFSLFTGILYEYLSTTSNVGIRINLARPVQTSLNGLYYSSYSTNQQEYLNQYHFISLPVTIHYQVLKKTPLAVNAGFSVKRLIRTNALEFNHSSQLYFYNRNAFNRTQFFPTFGIEYAMLKDRSLVVGPQLEGSLVSLEKNGSNEHLFIGSLQVKWLFLKN